MSFAITNYPQRLCFEVLEEFIPQNEDSDSEDLDSGIFGSKVSGSEVSGSEVSGSEGSDSEGSLDVVEIFMLFKKNYTIASKKGAGGFANVYKSLDEEDDKACALKIIKEKKYNWTIIDEKKILGLLAEDGGCERVIQARAFLEYQGFYALALPLATCSLGSYSTRSGDVFTLKKLCRVAQQLLEGLVYLEEKNVIHSDIKPGNILVFKGEDIKLADFGGAFEISYRRPDGNSFNTLPYIPPEGVIETGEHGYEADVWSVACTIAEVVLKNLVFPCPKTLTDPFDEYKEFRGDLLHMHQRELDDYPESLKARASGQGLYVLDSNLIEDQSKRSDFLHCFSPLLTISDQGLFNRILKRYEQTCPQENNSSKKLTEMLEKMFTLDPRERPHAKSLLQEPFFHEIRNEETPLLEEKKV